MEIQFCLMSSQMVHRFCGILDNMSIEMPNSSQQDLVFIKEWMKKEPHLPDDIDDAMVKKFLHSCFYSLENTKKCIDRFCTKRSEMSQVFVRRDPLAPNLQTAFAITGVANYKCGDMELLAYRLDDFVFDQFNFTDIMKTLTIQSDHWVKFEHFLPEGHIIMIDLGKVTLKLIPKINMMMFKEVIMYLLEGLPVRVKNVVIVNAPSFYEILYAIVKPVIPQEICEIIHFYPDAKAIQNFIDKKYIPSDYGGEAEPLKEISDARLKLILEQDRAMFVKDNLWKCDLQKKPKTNGNNAMKGSFRTLCID